MLADELHTAATEHPSKNKGDDDRIVELARHRDEVRYEIERHREVGDQGREQQLVPPTHPPIPQETREQGCAVGHETSPGSRVGPSAEHDQDEDEGQVQRERDARRDQYAVEDTHCANKASLRVLVESRRCRARS